MPIAVFSYIGFDVISLTAEEAKVAEAPEYYELRRYRLRRGPMVKRADDYFREALMPALRRHGTGGRLADHAQVAPSWKKA